MKRLVLACGLIVGFFSCGALLHAQADPDYVFSVGSATGVPFDTVSVSVTFDNTGLSVQSFGFGLCHEPSGATPLTLTPGQALDTVNGGQPADFVFTQISAEGVVMGVIVSLWGAEVMPPSVGTEVRRVIRG